MMEDDTAHAAARGRKACLLDADNTAVARIVGREEAGEAEQVAGAAALVAQGTLRHLCRTGLA